LIWPTSAGSEGPGLEFDDDVAAELEVIELRNRLFRNFTRGKGMRQKLHGQELARGKSRHAGKGRPEVSGKAAATRRSMLTECPS